MKRILSTIVLILWALWLGGLATLFMLVTRLFKEHNDLFHQTAPVIFHLFEQYQIVVAAAALLASFLWIIADRRPAKIVLFCLLAIAAAGSAISSAVITPKMETARLTYGPTSKKFTSLHGKSMMIYSADMLLLVIAGCILPTAKM
jgi:hypothetical protein